jgi:hypothetical protein
MGTEMTVYDCSTDVAISRPPAVVLEEARKAASALQDVVKNKQKPVIFNGEQYLEFEDWQTVGRFYGVTAKVVSTEFIDFGAVQGFLARAVTLRADGMEVSAAEAMCMNDEPNWKSKPLFQLRSMAQTRACAKSLRNVLAWVVVLAGYKPTPAEEMQEGTNGKPSIQQPTAKKTTELTARGIIEEVTVKTGTGAKGDWKKFGIKIGEAWFGTFDSKIGELAQFEKGHEVVLSYTSDGKYSTVVELVPVAVPE